MESKLSYLQMIQNVVNRQANNSFLLKGWSVTLIAALFALAAKDTDKSYIVVACFPALVFWILDAYFLAQERLFKRLYDHARQQKKEGIDFSMNTTTFNDKSTNLFLALFSKTLLLFHGSILTTIIFAVIFL